MVQSTRFCKPSKYRIIANPAIAVPRHVIDWGGHYDCAILIVCNQNARRFDFGDRTFLLIPLTEHAQRGHQEPRPRYSVITCPKLRPPRNVRESGPNLELMHCRDLQTQWNRGIVAESIEISAFESPKLASFLDEENQVTLRRLIDEIVE